MTFVVTFFRIGAIIYYLFNHKYFEDIPRFLFLTYLRMILLLFLNFYFFYTKKKLVIGIWLWLINMRAYGTPYIYLLVPGTYEYIIVVPCYLHVMERKCPSHLYQTCLNYRVIGSRSLGLKEFDRNVLYLYLKKID